MRACSRVLSTPGPGTAHARALCDPADGRGDHMNFACRPQASVHLFLWIDSCFEGECLKELLPPNVCAINATLQLDAKPQGEGSTRWQSYFAANMTQFLCSALEAAPSASYEELHAAVLDAQQAADMRSA
eukprot:6211065-Pleurochrysis_carterae.AAC.7